MDLPSEIRWESVAGVGAETKELPFGDGEPLKVAGPWWLQVVVENGRVLLTPRLCGTFSGKVVGEELNERFCLSAVA